MNAMCNILAALSLAALGTGVSGCMTATREYAPGEVRQTVTAFSEANIQNAVRTAVSSLYALDRIIEGEMAPLLDALRDNDLDDRLKLALEAKQ